MKLSKGDKEFIIESLNYTKLKFENYDKFPSYTYKQEQLKKVNDIILKVKKLNGK